MDMKPGKLNLILFHIFWQFPVHNLGLFVNHSSQSDLFQ